MDKTGNYACFSAENLQRNPMIHLAAHGPSGQRRKPEAIINSRTGAQMQNEATGLIVGWRAIAEATGRQPNSLRVQSSDGRLPVQPLRISGGRIAMTPAQIEQLKIKPA